jgi:hypothetical protein
MKQMDATEQHLIKICGSKIKAAYFIISSWSSEL